MSLKFIILAFNLLMHASCIFQQSSRLTQSFTQASNDTSVWPIFKPYPVFSTDSLQFCKYYMNSYLYYFTYSQRQYIFLSLQTCGFNLFSVNDPSNPKLEVNYAIQSGQINKSTFDTLRNLLFVCQSEGNVFYIDFQKNSTQVNLAFQTNNSLQAYSVEFIAGVQDAILVVCYNEIQIFQSQINNQQSYWMDLSNFKYYRSIVLQQANVIVKVQFINNLLLVGSKFIGLQVYSTDSTTFNKDATYTYLSIYLPTYQYVQDFHLKSNNILYLLMNYGGFYVYDFSACILSGTVHNCSNINYFSQQIQNTKSGTMYVSKDEKYIYTQFSSQGIIIYDITQQILKTFQTIQIKGESDFIALNDKENLIFFSGTLQFQIYIKSNTNNILLDRPNILSNIVQSYDINFYKDTTYVNPDISCIVDTNKGIVFLTRITQGIVVLQRQPQGILKEIIQLEKNVQYQYVMKFKYFITESLMYVTKGPAGLSVMDFTNPATPVYIQNNLTFGVKSPFFYFMDCNYQETMCYISSTQTGVVLIDISDKRNPKLLSIFNSNNLSIGSQTISQSVFMRNKSILFSSTQTYGIIVLDLTEKSNPKLISSLFTNEASGPLLTSDDKYLIISSTYKGLIICDTSDLTQLKIISTVQLIGGLIQGLFMSNEKYVVIPSYEEPAFYLIDIQDKLNPILLQTWKKQTPGNYIDVCIGQDENDGYLTSDIPLVSINLKSQIIFYQFTYQITTLQGTNQQTYQEIDSTQPIYVGQQLNMYVFPLYSENQVIIKSVYSYEDYILQPLQSWIRFSSAQNLLKINVVKDSLSQNSQGQYVETTINLVFQTFLKLTSSSFVNSYLGIDSSLSAKILNQCQLLGLVDVQNTVAQDFDPRVSLKLDITSISSADFQATLTPDKLQDINTAIKYVLQHSIVYYPIQLQISPSLKLNIDNPQQYIYSLQSQVTIYVSVANISQGKFVENNYSGVLSIFSQYQNEIKIEGDINNVNQALLKKIKFYSMVPQDQIVFNVQVSDGVNYDIFYTFSYQQISFITEQAKVQLKSGASLQNDLASKIPDSSIYILEAFYYQVSSDLYYGDSSTSLYYSAQILDGDQYVEIPVNFWLQFSAQDRMFSGTPNQSNFNQKVKIKLKVTDNYSTNEQFMEITVGKVPVSYVLQILIQVISPVIGLLGIWRYKYQIYNITNKKKYTYSKEVVVAGSIYQKQILLNNQNIVAANKVLQYLKKIITDDEIQKQLVSYYSVDSNYLEIIFNENTLTQSVNSPVNKNLSQQYDINDKVIEIQDSPAGQQEQIKQNLQFKYQAQDEIKDDQSPRHSPSGQNTDMKQSDILSASNSQCFPASNSQSQQNSQIFSPKCNYQQNQSITIFSKRQSVDQQRENRQKSISRRKLTKAYEFQQNFVKPNINDQNESQNRRKKSSIYQNNSLVNIFDDNMVLNYPRIIDYLIEQNKKEKQESYHLSEELVSQLYQQNSFIRQTFESFLAEYILQRDNLSYVLLEQLQQRAQQINNQSPDWYKYYCNIQANFDEISFNPLPKIVFDDNFLLDNIKQCVQLLNQVKIDNGVAKIPVSLYLIKQAIKACALGFVSDFAKQKYKTSGESINTEACNVKQIVSFNKREINLQIQKKKSYFQRFLSIFQKDIVQKPLIDNTKLPAWINGVEIVNNNILISGNPQKKDIGTVFLVVYSKDYFILREFEIEVVDPNVLQNVAISLKSDEENPYQQNNQITIPVTCLKTIQKEKLLSNYKDQETVFTEFKCQHSNEYTIQ
ncbi:hypothetical protein TTHERM_00976520 (macronuclear) [Tetrahymena thermophila SB210]|uniref:Dystroglycan-type cadherin-like domain-containing protein n=1 Tax=Tetrahymena thermophila (strain SB210) TaxID=312017 RepID=Q24GQ9_TETTS|nr:hypothetical protein TTHERM_00976520 [Tetrahymena thermophila SB210]EAS06948.2 hypothetical protein TTHERM_00976520 [Tetrahymena thermophila SB210]|eukprot:XP_001027190.2 hypothetical protein TTHERM_00976520 [Tetrahymena thermophila SB210]